MLMKNFKFKLDKYIYENWTFRIVTLALIAIIGFQTYEISTKINNQRIVFMPPKVITKEFWITGNQVSKSYLEQMGLFIIYNLFNITKDSAKNNIANILSLVDPQAYYDVKAKLKEQVNYIVDNGISRIFYPSVVNVDKKGVIKITGIVKDIISNKIVNDDQLNVKIYYKIKNGRFWLIDVKVKKGIK